MNAPKKIWFDIDECSAGPVQFAEDEILYIRADLAEPKAPFVRLTEEEVTEILTSAYDMYAAICWVENRLVEKNSINRSDPDSVDLQSRCRGDKL